MADQTNVLTWSNRTETSREAVLLNPDDTVGVLFSLEYRPTCYRRGAWLLRIEVMSGEFHHDWGCFDEADQPIRNYHQESAALSEAEQIARVLKEDFIDRRKPLPNPSPSPPKRRTTPREVTIMLGLLAAGGMRLPGASALFGYRGLSKTNCATCGKEIPPGKAGRDCQECREKPKAKPEIVVIEDQSV